MEQFLEKKCQLKEKGFTRWNTASATREFLLATRDKNIIELEDKPHLVMYSVLDSREMNPSSLVVLYDADAHIMYYGLIKDLGG